MKLGEDILEALCSKSRTSEDMDGPLYLMSFYEMLLWGDPMCTLGVGIVYPINCVVQSISKEVLE